MTTPYERLMTEQWPTGTFGHSRPQTPPKPHTEPWTPEEQAEHRATLEAALNGWHDEPRPALRLIQPDQTPDAA